MRPLVLPFLLVIPITATAVPTVHEIPPRDSEALIAALCEASQNAEEDHVINLPPFSRYSLSDNPPFNFHNFRFGFLRCDGGEAGRIRVRRLTINGHGSTIALDGSDGFTNDGNGTLDLRDLTIEGANHSAAVVNRGTAHLTAVTIRNSAVAYQVLIDDLLPRFRTNQAAAIVNHGELTAHNLFLESNRVVGAPVDDPKAGGIFNGPEAHMQVHHLTSLDNAGDDDIVLDNQGELSLERSLVLEASAHACRGTILGTFNQSRSEGCAAERSSLHPGQFIETRISAGRRVPMLTDGSPARDAGPDGPACGGTDIRGYLRGAPRSGPCDLGAVEMDGPVDLQVGTIDGLWYQPEHDGHYLQVLRVSDDRYHMIWNTFDPAGEPAWFYGVGQRDGHRLDLVLYRNRGLQLDRARWSGSSRVESVGDLTVLVWNCRRAAMEFSVDTLGQGRFALQRLAFDANARCPTR